MLRSTLGRILSVGALVALGACCTVEPEQGEYCGETPELGAEYGSSLAPALTTMLQASIERAIEGIG